MNKNIGYHTRRDSNNAVKVTGGSFGGNFDLETVKRLVKSHFSVRLKPSGRPVFVDRENREVSLYISVDPEWTDEAKAALAEKAAEGKRRRLLQDAEEQELQTLLDQMDTQEALRRLKGAQ